MTTSSELEALSRKVADLAAELDAAEQRVADLTAAGNEPNLRDSERIYRALFDGTSVAVTLRAADFCLLDCNRAALRLYGCNSLDELRQMLPPDAAPPHQADGRDSATAFRAMRAQLEAEGMFRGEWWVKRRDDGRVVPTEVWATTIRLRDGRILIQTMLDDITARKAAERSLRRAAERDAMVGAVARRFVSSPGPDAVRAALDAVAAFTGASAARLVPASEPETAAPDDVLSVPLAGGGIAGGRLELAGPPGTRFSDEDTAAARLVAEILAIALGREEAERARRASEARSRILIEQSRDAIFAIDLENKLRFASPACRDILGYAPEEMIAMDTPFASLVVPEALSRLLATREDIAARRFPVAPLSFAFRRKDGGVVDTESIISGLVDEAGAGAGVLIITRDVTERRRAEEQTRRRAARDALLARLMRGLLDAAPDAPSAEPLRQIGHAVGASAVALFAPAASSLRAVASWSDGAPGADPFGLEGSSSPGGLQGGRVPGDPGPSSDDESADAALAAWLSTTSSARPGCFLSLVGHAGRVFGVLAAAPAAGSSFAAEDTSLLSQVGELFAVAEVRRLAQEAMAAAKEDAVAASLTKSAFLANMSHELRTPLNGVLGMVDLLGRTPLDEQQRRYAHVARASASLLLSVINDILDFSKIEAGRLDLESVEFTLSTVVEDVASMFAAPAEEKGIELCCEPSGPDEVLLGAPTRIRQVLVNLVGNAIKFTRRGEVVVRARTTRAGDTSEVRVEVRDTGIGIGEEARAKLFQPFTQVDASSTREHGGTGLGLAISRQLVELMGGEIGCTSEPGAGSCFWFSLRVPVSEAPPSARVADVRLAGVRVLAVDDNATNRELLAAHVTSFGMACDTAASGEEGLAALVAAAERGEPYRVAILDRQMPGLDGRELARRIKADPRTRAVVLLMLGSVVRPLDPVEQRELGVARYGTKPVARPALLRMLSTALADTPPEVPVPRAVAQADARTDVPLVLLVEDSPINAEVTGEILRAAGYAFDLVTDGLRAVAAVQRRPYDFVLMDCQLPELDGYDATRRIRELEAEGRLGSRRRLPIVALTASAMRGDPERCLAAGMDGHIAKPVDASRLLTTMADHLPRAPGPPRAAAPRVVNLEAAVARLQHNRALLERIARQFGVVAREGREALRRAVAARDPKESAFLCHRLRGQASSFDAEAFVQRIEALEGAVRRDDWGLVVSLLPAVEGELDRLLDALAAHLEA